MSVKLYVLIYLQLCKNIFLQKSYIILYHNISHFQGLKKCSQMAYSSHMVKQGNRTDTCQYLPVSTPQPRSGQEQPSLFAASRPLEFLLLPTPPLVENPISWHTPQEHRLRSSLCQDDLAHSWHIDWNSVETFESIYFF